jgi:hypothetical protein
MQQSRPHSSRRVRYRAASAVVIALFGLLAWQTSPSKTKKPSSNAPSQQTSSSTPAAQSLTSITTTQAGDAPEASGSIVASVIGTPTSSDFASTSLVQSTPESIAKNEFQLLALNQVANVASDEEFRRLVDDANVAAIKGGDEQEREDITNLLESRDYLAAADVLLAIAERPGGATTFSKTDLAKALRAEGRTQEAEAFETELGLRTLSTLERMEDLGLGEAAPVVFDITFWRANQYLKRGTPEWRRAFESLSRVGARIPDNSTARSAEYVRSLGVWARQTLEKFDAEEKSRR